MNILVIIYVLFVLACKVLQNNTLNEVIKRTTINVIKWIHTSYKCTHNTALISYHYVNWHSST